jgi:hypothetical protein
MILLHPRAPFIFGAVMIGLLAAYLTVYHPMPGPLSAPHAAAVAQKGLADCQACHTSQGLPQAVCTAIRRSPRRSKRPVGTMPPCSRTGLWPAGRAMPSTLDRTSRW